MYRSSWLEGCTVRKGLKFQWYSLIKRSTLFTPSKPFLAVHLGLRFTYSKSYEFSVDVENKRKKHLERCQRYFPTILQNLLNPSKLNSTKLLLNIGSHLQHEGLPLCTTPCWRSSLSLSTGSLDSSMRTLFSHFIMIMEVNQWRFKVSHFLPSPHWHTLCLFQLFFPCNI